MQSKLPSIRFIRKSLQNNQYRLTRHATIARRHRSISLDHLKAPLFDGEIVEQYPDDTPYPSCLVLGWLPSGDPLHIVCSRGLMQPALRIVTVYEPDDHRWKDDYTTRK